MKNSKIILALLMLLIFVLGGCSANEHTPVSPAPVPAVSQQAPPAPSETVAATEQTPVAAAEQPKAETETQKDAPTKPEVTPKQDSKENSDTSEKQGGSIKIEGTGVKKPIELSLGDIKGMQKAFVEDDYFSLNNYGTKKYFHFKGASVLQLLKEKAGLKDEAKSVTFVAEDGYSVTYTVDEVKREDYIDEQNPEKKYKVIIAWEEDGKEYSSEDGSPFKLVIGQKEPGDINKPNWVQNLSIITVE